MADIREALAQLLWEHIDFREDDVAGAPDAILAEFLVIPRTEVTTEYGVVGRNGILVERNALRAEVARHRAVHIWALPLEAASYRQLWAGPWSPIPLPEDGGQS
jgi:hypothetical protein